MDEGRRDWQQRIMLQWKSSGKKQDKLDAQKVQTSHPPNPGGYFTLPP
jgi:hypothetical protein